jgi:methionyl-tRNA formyltransferase
MPNLLIFTNRDLASLVNLNCLLPRIHQQVRHIYLSDKVGGAQKEVPPQLQTLKFFEQNLPNELLFPAWEAAKRDLQGEHWLSFGELSQKYGIPIASCNDVRSPVALEQIRSLAPDLVLSVRFGRIFGAEFLKIPRLGVVNFHSGRLPEYRGVLAVFRALQNGDAEITGTLHFIDDGTIDTGRVLGTVSIQVESNDGLLDHILRLYPAASDLLVSAIQRILAGEVISTHPQDQGVPAYYSFPTEQEWQDFENKGYKIVDPENYLAWMRRFEVSK